MGANQQKNPEIEVLRAFIGAALNHGVPGYRADWLLESLRRIEEQLEAAQRERDSLAARLRARGLNVTEILDFDASNPATESPWRWTDASGHKWKAVPDSDPASEPKEGA